MRRASMDLHQAHFEHSLHFTQLNASMKECIFGNYVNPKVVGVVRISSVTRLNY